MGEAPKGLFIYLLGLHKNAFVHAQMFYFVQNKQRRMSWILYIYLTNVK